MIAARVPWWARAIVKKHKRVRPVQYLRGGLDTLNHA
jgi:hypothetical protein